MGKYVYAASRTASPDLLRELAGRSVFLGDAEALCATVTWKQTNRGTKTRAVLTLDSDYDGTLKIYGQEADGSSYVWGVRIHARHADANLLNRGDWRIFRFRHDPAGF